MSTNTQSTDTTELFSAEEEEDIISKALEMYRDCLDSISAISRELGNPVPEEIIVALAQAGADYRATTVAVSSYVQKLIEDGKDEEFVVGDVLTSKEIIDRIDEVTGTLAVGFTEVFSRLCAGMLNNTIEQTEPVSLLDEIERDTELLSITVVSSLFSVQTIRFYGATIAYMAKPPAALVAEQAKKAMRPYFDFLLEEMCKSERAETMYHQLVESIDVLASKEFESTSLDATMSGEEAEEPEARREAEVRPPKTDTVGLDISKTAQIVYSMTGNDCEIVPNGKPQSFEIGERGKLGSLMVGLSFEDDTGAKLSVQFNEYDWLVSNVVNTLVDACTNNGAGPLKITAQQIVRTLNATPDAHPSPEQIAKVEESLEKMFRANVTIDLANDKTYKEDGPKAWRAHLYDGMNIVDGKMGGKNVSLYVIPQPAVTWQVSKRRHQMFTVPANALETPGKRTTVEQKEIQATLLRRLAPMRGARAESASPVITWAYLYDTHGVDKSDRKRTAAFRKKVLDQLQLWCDQGLILDFYQIKKDHSPVRPDEKRPTIYGVIVETEENREAVESDMARFV